MLTTCLVCLVAISALNLLLVYDLYGRSARLVVLYEEARRVVNKIHHTLVTEE
jgi:hypothetical protein